MNKSLLLIALGVIAFGGGFIFTYNSPEDQDSTSIISTSSPVASAENTSQKPILSSGGQWRWDELKQDWVPNVTQKDPSERALKVASQVYVQANKKQQEEIVSALASKGGNVSEAIRNFALRLDSDPVYTALLEAAIAKDSLSFQREFQMPSWNCTTSQIGQFLNTRCY